MLILLGLQESSGGNSSQSNKSTIITVDCDTIELGINIINNYLTNKVNLAHCSVIVFSEELCLEGINQYVSTLVNNAEIRPTCNVVVSKCDAEEFLSASGNKSEEFSARYYESILSSSDYTGFSVETVFSIFYSKFNSDIGSAVAILTDVIDDVPQNIGLAVFNGSNLVR